METSRDASSKDGAETETPPITEQIGEEVEVGGKEDE